MFWDWLANLADYPIKNEGVILMAENNERNQNSSTGENMTNRAGSDVGEAVGTVGGGAIGAAVGSILGPLGTVAGGLAGGALGNQMGEGANNEERNSRNTRNE
jgi:outer membrane lipoprotein SlyB